MDGATIERCEFEDAGGVHGGVTGGALFLTWAKASRVSHNRFRRSGGPARNFYGVKAREARGCRFDHNTFLVNFSLELPHEHDLDNEIDHNYVWGAISLPKNGGGGSVPPGGTSFCIHHNCFRSSYAFEGPRNGLEIDHNLFDLTDSPAYGDGGNLVSSWGAAAPGPSAGRPGRSASDAAPTRSSSSTSGPSRTEPLAPGRVGAGALADKYPEALATCFSA